MRQYETNEPLIQERTSRRSFLKFGAALPVGLATSNVLAETSWIQASAFGRAKSLILIWLKGAPSHIDTFDPKPDSNYDVRGPLSAISTRTPGLFLGELLPELANRSHLFSIVRSHTTSIDSLSTSIDEGQLKHPGSLKEAFPKPDVILEGENCKVFNRSSEFLQRFGNGSSHQNLDTRLNVVERSLRDQATHRLAHPIQRHSAFARNCRLARQLIESNVKTIQINWSEVETGWATGSDTDWDTHTYNFERLTQSLGPIFDRSLSMLLDDLNDRGLLESTLVVAMGEFGRSPDINNHGGRDDWSSCYSSLWSGAGIRPGQVIGCTNKIGSEIVSSPITPKEIHTTIQHLYGEPKTLTQIHQQSLLLSSLT